MIMFLKPSVVSILNMYHVAVSPCKEAVYERDRAVDRREIEILVFVLSTTCAKSWLFHFIEQCLFLSL